MIGSQNLKKTFVAPSQGHLSDAGLSAWITSGVPKKSASDLSPKIGQPMAIEQNFMMYCITVS